jgi:hypothetical protein
LEIDNSRLVRAPISWHFFSQWPWRLENMAKTANGSKPKKDRPTTEASPPLLSEKLIAQFQNAVCAARRKQISDRDDASATPPEKEL